MKYTRKFVRPNTETPWYTPGDDFMSYIQENFIDTGLCTSFRQQSLDDSECVLTLTSIWADDIDYATLSTDPIWKSEVDKEIAWNEGSEILMLDVKKDDEVIKSNAS